MSTATARALRPVREHAAPRRILRALERPAGRKPRMAYAVVALAGALTIGAGQMALSIAMTQGGYQERALMQEVRELQLQRQSATDALVGLSSPQQLATSAAALGMVINESPTYLRLSDGAVLGAGNAATWHSTVDAAGRGSVPNALVAARTQAAAAPIAAETATVVVEAPALPPALSEGLPSPVTH